VFSRSADERPPLDVDLAPDPSEWFTLCPGRR